MARKKRIVYDVDPAEIAENIKKWPTESQSYYEAFSLTLNRLLAEKGIDQERLSDETGIATGTISNCRKGKGNPTLINIRILADRLGVDCNYLMTGIKAEHYIISEYTGLSEKAIERLHDISTIGNNDRYKQIIQAVNQLLENEDYGNNLLWYVSEYLNDRIDAVALPDYECDDDHKRLSNTVLLLSSGVPINDINVKDLQAVFLQLIQTALIKMKSEGSER